MQKLNNAVVNTSSATNVTIPRDPAGKRAIGIAGYKFQAGGTVVVEIKDSGGTSYTGPYNLSASCAEATAPLAPATESGQQTWFDIPVGLDCVITITDSVQISGHVAWFYKNP